MEPAAVVVEPAPDAKPELVCHEANPSAAPPVVLEVSREALKRAIEAFPRTPALFRRRRRRGDNAADAENVNSDAPEAKRQRVVVPCWRADPKYDLYCKLKTEQEIAAAQAAVPAIPNLRKTLETSSAVYRQSVHKARQKGVASGRTYTSQYRGVHQTFPTRRWEAQFRRGGKPTSLGCFDLEEEAARAYDKMMLWCDLHNQETRSLGLTRNGVTNFPPEDYAGVLPQLAVMTQEELVQELRAVGRMQAANAGHGSASKRQRAPAAAAGGERPGSGARGGRAAAAADAAAAAALAELGEALRESGSEGAGAQGNEGEEPKAESAGLAEAEHPALPEEGAEAGRSAASGEEAAGARNAGEETEEAAGTASAGVPQGEAGGGAGAEWGAEGEATTGAGMADGAGQAIQESEETAAAAFGVEGEAADQHGAAAGALEMEEGAVQMEVDGAAPAQQ